MSSPPDSTRPPDATPPWEPESPWQRPPAGAPQDGPPGLGGQAGYGAPQDGPPGLGGQPGSGAPPPYSPPPPAPPPGYGPPPPAPPPGYGPPGHAPPAHGPQQHPQPPYGLPPISRAKPGRRVLALVGAFAVAAIVLVGVLAFVVFRGSPRDTADAFMSALRGKDIDKAHSMLCKDGRQKESKEELRRGFDLDERTITGYQLGTERNRQREGKDETLIPVTITYDRGAEVRIDLGIWNEGGQKICSLNPPGG